MQQRRYRSLWLSDIHLGNKDCKADFLLSFLATVEVDALYLVGDIVDMWEMQRQFRWPDAHNQVMHTLMKMSHEGTRIVYLPGNHDAPLQTYSGMSFGDIEFERELIHTTAAGKRYLVLHGDQFDADVTLGRFHAWMGDKAYDLLLFVNRWYNRLRQLQKRDYFSLAGYIKQHIKGANAAIARYRQACCRRAAELGLDGVICGHIHHPQSTMEDGIHYINDGDWIENCSALCETPDGTLELVYFHDIRRMTLCEKQPDRVAASKAA
ncbi:UDP-2,3-diacylglucosamine diphosphatase [Alteromonas sp. CYL-A6]|uniref:UDP-2,3-diacylglucosamine diphosphatase n=1 Tax=Alteromonas nitratireducens TaxID=3390813 RepID=UPI0034BFD950